MRRTPLVLAATAMIIVGPGPAEAAAGERPAILLTGYWPPSNEMIRRFSPDPVQNPDGWVGEDWEGRGYDVYAYFPEFNPRNCGNCGKGTGDLEVDYQDTSMDFWPIADGVAPIAVITFSRGGNNLSWEMEMNQFNRDAWINDYQAPFQPTPSPPDDSVPIGFLRPSQLPVVELVQAIEDANIGLDPFVCYTGDGGGFLSEFIAYHGVWYQSLHDVPGEEGFCYAAGHVHVGQQIPWETARQAAEVTVRTVIQYVEQRELMFAFPNGQPQLIDPFGGTRVRVEVTGFKKDPAPDTGTLYYSTGTLWTAVPMEAVGENVYDAVFPAFDCGDRVDYYFSAQTQGGEDVFNPFAAPLTFYGADAYTGEVLTFEDDFEQDTGWTVVTSGGVEGAWERGVPAGGDGGPDQDSDGSGQCYVTGLAPGEDVDGFYTRLLSPPLDASDPDATIEFDAWLENGAGSEWIIVDLSDDGGQSFRTVENYVPLPGEWRHKAYRIADIDGVENTDQVVIRFSIGDFSTDNLLEAGIDAVKVVNGFECADPCVEDLDGSGSVGFDDLLLLLAAWGPCEACPEDLNDDEQVGFDDLLLLLAAWGPCE